MLADELPHATFVRARSILEWRLWPERLDHEAAEFALQVWEAPLPTRRRRPGR